MTVRKVTAYIDQDGKIYRTYDEAKKAEARRALVSWLMNGDTLDAIRGNTTKSGIAEDIAEWIIDHWDTIASICIGEQEASDERS